MLTTHSSLLIRLRTREDSEAWRRFAHLYAPLIGRWVSRLGVDPHQADDLVQEVFLVLLDQIGNFIRQRPGSFRGWLRTVSQNKATDWLRKQKQTTFQRPMAELEVAIADPQVWLSEQEYRAVLVGSALQLMRESFSATTWQAVWDHVALGQSAAVVAQRLGISENAVYLARGRVLKRLRQELDGLWE